MATPTLDYRLTFRMRNGSPTIYEHDFPHATLRTNVLGSFLMAFPLIETFEPLERLTIAPEHRSGLLIGPLREFTTFSTFSLETMLLVVLCWANQKSPLRCSGAKAERGLCTAHVSDGPKRAQSRTTLTTVTSDINLAISSAIRAMRIGLCILASIFSWPRCERIAADPNFVTEERRSPLL